MCKKKCKDYDEKVVCPYIESDAFRRLNLDVRRLRRSSSILSDKTKDRNVVNLYTGLINGTEVLLIQFEKNDKMGTIGVSEGEKLTLAFEYAAQKKLPVIAVVASAGIRIQEGTPALMQMIKMASAVKQHSDKGLLFISIVTNPTLGGASASFVSLADIIIAENGAIYGFSGKRIVEITTHEQLPADFQSAEYVKQHGMVDIVANKDEIKTLLTKLLRSHINRYSI